jgi:hypothetical protein
MLRGSRDLIIDQTKNTQGFRDTDMILVYLSMNHDSILQKEGGRVVIRVRDGQRGKEAWQGWFFWRRKCQEKKKMSGEEERIKCKESQKMSREEENVRL